MLLPGLNVFYEANLERKFNEKCLTLLDNSISSSKYLSNQMKMNHTWQHIEEFTSKTTDVFFENSNYFIQQSGIDLKSSIQLTFDVFSQLIEVNSISSA